MSYNNDRTNQFYISSESKDSPTELRKMIQPTSYIEIIHYLVNRLDGGRDRLNASAFS
jgi:hypothetical protein